MLEKKNINKNGKERTRYIKDNVSAMVKLNQKISIATLSVTYKIFDVTSGILLDIGEVNGEYEWNYVWISSIEGDKKAIPDDLPINEIRFPSQNEMMRPANEIAAHKLYRMISNFAYKNFE